MSPIGPYADFNECVISNQDKTNPEAFCAWLEHKITGSWPGDMSVDRYPEAFWEAYDAALTSNKSEKDAYQEATDATKAAGYSLSRFGWVKEFQAPAMKSVTGVRVFGSGTWTDSAGYTREWTEEDLDKMVEAFEANVPAVVPLKCGHTSDEFNQRIAEALGVPVENVTGDQGQGQIALGRMTSLVRKGSWNIASFDNVPEPIADLIEGGQYSTVSVEIEDTVGDYGPVITGVALLGAEEPAVEGATLEKALVFGGTRKGARVWSFKVGDDIPTSELKAEFDDIRSKLADIVKGKRGAPIFRALFGNLAELFDRLTNSRHTAQAEDVEALLQKGRPPKAWWDRCTAKVSGWPGVADVDSFCGSVWFHDDPIPADSFSSEEAATQAEIKFKGGTYQMPKAILEALGLTEEATEEEVVAAINALMEKAVAAAASAAAPGGELQAELQKANERIASLEGQLSGQTSLSAWKEKTAKFTSIPGTPAEHAESLAETEKTAGKEAAEKQYAALEKANELTEQAMKNIGNSRTKESTDWEAEVQKYMAAHNDPNKSDKENRAAAVKAVSKLQPDLYFSRRDSWDQ